MIYFFVFVGSMAVDLIPVMAPPACLVRSWGATSSVALGKFISDAAMVFAGRYAATTMSGMLRGTFGAKSILTGAVTLIVTGAFLFIDWHALLVKKTLRFDFSIWSSRLRTKE